MIRRVMGGIGGLESDNVHNQGEATRITYLSIVIIDGVAQYDSAVSFLQKDHGRNPFRRW